MFSDLQSERYNRNLELKAMVIFANHYNSKEHEAIPFPDAGYFRYRS